MYFMVHTFLQYIEVLGAVMGKYSIVLCTTLLIVQIYNTFQIFAQCWQNSAVFSQSTYKYILHGFCNVFPRELANVQCTVLYIVLY